MTARPIRRSRWLHQAPPFVLTEIAGCRYDRLERLTDVAIAAFLWSFRIVVVLIVVVGSILTLASGKYSVETWVEPDRVRR